MVDKVSKIVRSYIMSRIRGKGTMPERTMRQYLKSKRFRFREHFKIAGFRVDFVLPRRKVAIFIDGCFWHGCPKCFRRPKSNVKYWNKKIKDNVARDKRIDITIRKEGWKILHIWEHRIKKHDFDKLIFNQIG